MNQKINFIITSRLLDHIGLAMYSSLPKAISELIANSYDADATEVKVIIPEEINKETEIVISDNGNGMNENFIRNSYMKIGSDNREEKEKSPRFKRPLIGSKGIGKLSGLGIANVMYIETVNNGKKCKFEINRKNLDEKGKNLEEIGIPLVVKKTKESNGTVIYLREPLSHISTMSNEELRSFFVKEFGFPKNFSIFVNGQRYSPEDIPGKKIEIRDKVDKYGEVFGKITIAKEPKDVKKPAGIITKVRGRRVRGPELFDINSHGHRYQVAERIIGEIEVPFFDPEESEKSKDKLDKFIISTSRDGFNLNHPKFIAYKNWIENKLIEISRNLENEQSEERRRKFLQNKNVQNTLKKLPKEIQGKIVKLIEEVIPKLNELSQKDAIIVMDLLIKSIGSNEIIGILRKLGEADVKDIQKLAHILEEWGIYEISSTTEHIKNRLLIIDKFEEVIKDINSLEYEDIHKLLEKNLWLLNDNYTIYSSNASLKTVLANKISKKFRKHESDRPDLIVKTSSRKVLIIELKRPSHKITSKDFAQVSEYKNIIKANQPNAELLESYLIGNEFDEAVRNPEYEKIGVFLKSYSEILQEAKERYGEILNILKEK
ncbi:MAG: ATP-binding protein [Elusimicrobiota bacterium]